MKMDNNYKQVKLMDEIITLHKLDLSCEEIEQILRSQCFTIVCIIKSMNPYLGQFVNDEFEEEWEDFHKEVSGYQTENKDQISNVINKKLSYAENLEMLHTALCTIVQDKIDGGGLLR
jgi:hypothetical protein